MLVLTRKVGESIVIDGDITVRVTAVQGNRIKLAIDAPRSRRILRGEIAGERPTPPAGRGPEASWTSTKIDPPRPAACIPG